MVVVPPEEDDSQVEAGQPDVPDSVAQPSTSEHTSEPAALETEIQENLVFGVPSDELGGFEENPIQPGSNNLLTSNNAVAANTADTQQTALPAPVVPLQSTSGTVVGTHTGSLFSFLSVLIEFLIVLTIRRATRTRTTESHSCSSHRTRPVCTTST